jgi:hypothetical protein
MAESLRAEAPAGFSAELARRLRSQMPQISQRMEAAILEEVSRYAADPGRYRQPVLQRCRLATRMFVRILATGRPPGRREIGVVQAIARSLAREGEPLEPLLHALRIGLRLGWDDTVRVSLDHPAAPPELMLPLAAQVFEYIDQLSSRIAEAYATEVEERARAQFIDESALFEDLIAGRAGADRVEARAVDRPSVALALAPAGKDPAASRRIADTVAGRVRSRFPRSVEGQRRGVAVWLLAREPMPAALQAAAAGAEVAFGFSSASEQVPLGRAVDEAVVAAHLGVELAQGESPAIVEYPRVYAYAALRSDPVGMARYHAALLAPLADHPVLLETLRRYFASNRSVSRTATLVHRHRQSVIYRLQRAAQLLNIDLNDAEAVFRLEAAARTLPDGQGIA